jgi:hypothetical protein
VDPDGRDILNAYRTLMKSAGNATLGESKELIQNVGCVLTAYTRMASTLLGEEISLTYANEIAIQEGLFSGNEKNLLTPENGAALVNAILRDKGIDNITVSFEGSYNKGVDGLLKYDEANSSTESSYFVTARIYTHDTEGNFYDHTVNIDANAYKEGGGGPNLLINDTSGVRSQLVEDPSLRSNTLKRLDFFKIIQNQNQE